MRSTVTRVLPSSQLRPRCSCVRARRRMSVAVRASDWKDASGSEENSGLFDDMFEKDTSRIIGRVMTARAVQACLAQLSNSDLYIYQWLNNFVADHPPMQDDFLLVLLAQPPQSKMDPSTATKHYINPSELANRVIAIREDLAVGVAKHLERDVKATNIGILRKHLEKHTYTTGSFDQGSPRAPRPRQRGARK